MSVELSPEEQRARDEADAAYRAQREEELAAVERHFSEQATRFGDLVGKRLDADEFQRALETVTRLGRTDDGVVAALVEAYGETITLAALELELHPDAVRSQLASVVDGADNAAEIGPFFGLDLGRRSERRVLRGEE